jgi:hypothetical protein
MSVSEGTLTDTFRDEVLAFYGEHFGWTEMESLRRPDRMTIAVGHGDYVNVRERPDPVPYTGYEHFGLRLASADAVEATWAAIDADRRPVELEPMEGSGDYRHFRVRYLLPLTVEVQSLPAE